MSAGLEQPPGPAVTDVTVLRVEMLGGLKVATGDGREIRIPSRKAQALLACLALRPGVALARDYLAALLWDESDTELARASLRQALAALRRGLPAPAAAALLCDATSVSLDPSRVASDVAQFRELVRTGSAHALGEAAEHFAGALLEGLEARSAAFEAWIEEHRRTLHRELVHALERAATQCRAAGDLAGTTLLLTRLVGIEPANESGHRELMDTLARQGRYTEALRQYRTCIDALRRDLDVAPEPATEALYRDILRRRRATAPGTGGHAVDDVTSPGEDDDDPATKRSVDVEAAPAPVTTLREAVVLVTRIERAADLRGDDPEAVRDRWAAVDARQREVVERWGGLVERPSQGESVAAFGLGALTGNEVERAVRAGGQLATCLEGTEGARLAVGIARGLVLPAGVAQPFPIAGQPVHAARELARAAPEGVILVAADVAAQLSGRYALDPAGASGPAGAFRVRLECAAASPAAMTRLAGRRAELAMLDTLLERVLASRCGRTVVVRGDPGIGKSTLLERLAVNARAQGAAIHVLQVLDFGQPAGERPVPSLAAALLDMPADADASGRRSALEAALRSGVIETDDAVPAADLLAVTPTDAPASLLAGADPVGRERGRFRVLRRLLEQAAARRPLLVVVEDVHWADESEVGQLADLAGSVATLPVLLAISTRADGDPISTAWRARARGCPVTTLDLAPLADDEARELAAAYVGLGEDVRERCLETAEGNPLFLVQLLRTAEAGLTTTPGSVRALLLARVERLTPETQRLAHAAAALGLRFSLGALRHVAGDPAADVTSLETAGLLACDGEECRFAHALIRAAVHEALLRSTRRELHRRAALWFESRDAGLYAEHLAAAEDPGAAAAYLAAATQERRACQFDRALSHAETARELPANPAVHCDANAELGDIQLARGQTENALASYCDSLALALTAGQRARARLGVATGLRVMDRYDDALATLEDAERDALDEGDPRRLGAVWTLRGNLHFPRGEIDECLRAHERALELAQDACSAEDVARALGGIGDAHYQRGGMRTALAHFSRCLELCKEHGLIGLELAYQPMSATAQYYVGEFESAIDLARRCAAAARHVGDLRSALLAQCVQASVANYQAEYQYARELAASSVVMARELGARRFEAESMVMRGLAELGLGLTSEALATLEEGARRARESAPNYCGPWALASLAQALGPGARARALLAEGEELLARGSVSHNHLEYRMLAIESYLDARDWPAVAAQADALAEFTRDEPLPWAELVIGRARALVEAADGPVEPGLRRRLRELLETAERMGFAALVPRLRSRLD